LRNKAFPDLFPHKRAAVSLLRPAFLLPILPGGTAVSIWLSDHLE
jgi:hypothetical protein